MTESTWRDPVQRIEVWIAAGVVTPRTQIVDLSDCGDMIAEMASANSDAAAPIFARGEPLSPSCLLIVGHIAMIVSKSDGCWRIGLALECEQDMRKSEVSDLISQLQSISKNDPEGFLKVKNSIPDFDEHYANMTMDIDTTPMVVTVIPGHVVPADVSRGTQHLAHLASSAFEFIALPFVSTESVLPPRAMRRRLDREGKAGVTWIAVKIKRGTSCHGKAGDEDAIRHKLHFVSGHWRKSPGSAHRRMIEGEWRIWIEGHWRGNADLGVNLHRYIMPLDRMLAA